MIIVRGPLRVAWAVAVWTIAIVAGFSLPRRLMNWSASFTLHKTFPAGRSANIPNSNGPNNIKYPVLGTAIRLVGADDYVEIASIGDIPAGIGLGLSGSFTTALLRVGRLTETDRLLRASARQ